ncbi:right-handed parallel beta-helix repeat-containing protein [Limnovirga soli]|uniref:Right handed beta helix domain-containing protein n=1 Tax=Limnovirga soli TaxID=2656915 RepID=A0A8J8FAM6_9BACT|nr:right-handed parallel beta-helix repeat-containing protein [Limnovirga soli]NNV54493.1 hypothetical protein [Limnovirga soli]
MQKLLFTALLFFIIVSCYAGNNYFISAAGNDNNDGLTPQHSWRSLGKINSMQFTPGDTVLLEGGTVFNGEILLDSLDSGTPEKPVVISAYGNGHAIINAENATGFLGYNTSYIYLQHLEFRGSGVDFNNGAGIHFYSDKKDRQCEGIRVENCTVKGFKQEGVLFSCAEGEEVKGFNNVKISNCVASNNGQAGISSYGGQTLFHHTNFIISNCKAFNNRGIIGKTDNHSGNGIVMGGVANLLIEHCLAYENGADNRCTAGGPVGIWVWLCKNAIIQYCESHHNHAGLNKDGGGFDIDGGSSNCIIQYCYSHDNEGAGYLLAEYGALLPFTNNTIRFNVSVNDGRKNSYGGIAVWGAAKNYEVTNTFVYNNTVYCDDANLINGTPSGLYTMGHEFKKVVVANNIFASGGKALAMYIDDAIDTSQLYLVSNNYFFKSGQAFVKTSINALEPVVTWLSNQHGQESVAGLSKNVQLDPGFKIGKSNLYNKDQFITDIKSKLLKQGISLSAMYGVDMPVKDFLGKPIGPHNVFIGATH